MAIIYSYPYVSTVNDSDTLVISVSDSTADNGFLTKSLTADDLASYVTARVNLNFGGDTGAAVVNLDTQSMAIEGTANEIETVAIQGNSRGILQIGLPDNVTIGNNLTVGGDFTGDRGTFTGPLAVGNDLTVSGETQTDTLLVDNDATIDGSLEVANTLTVVDNQGNGSTIDSQLSMDNNRITNLSNPINSQDAATKVYVDTAVTGLLEFKGTFRADSGLILSGTNAGSYIYNCPGGAGTRVAIDTGDYYIVANTGGQFYCSGDLLQVGDSIVASQDAAADTSTASDWGILEGDNVEGTGLANTIPLWTDSQVLGNSNITQNLDGSITISENLLVDQKEIEASTMAITGVAEISGELDKSFSKIVNLGDPTAAQDAATKAYVDAVDLDFTGNSGTGNVQQGSTFDILGSGPITTSASGTTLTINSSAAEGTGTTQTLPIWSDGPAGVLGNSTIRNYNPGSGGQTNVEIATIGGTTPLVVDFAVGGTTTFEQTPGSPFIKFSNDSTGFYTRNFQMRGTLAVGRSQQSTAVTLDVGAPTDTRPAAWFRNGVVISNNPAGVQVDNTSMVIGAGNNDNISGSDHCLIVGSGNQITSNSDQSVAFGQGNSITDSTDAFAVGNSNTVSNSLRTLTLGYDNNVQSGTSFIAGGGNTVNTGDTNIAIGFNNTVNNGNAFAIGNIVTSNQGEMVLGFRNNPSEYPSTDINNGLSEVKFVVATGASNTNNSNALLITAGGKTGGNPLAFQIPRIILPTVPTFSASNDAAADAIGVPEGALYQNNGVVQINRGGGSTTDPLAGGGGVTQTTGNYTPQLIADTPSEWVISSYSTQQGKWVRIGNMVFCDFSITIPAANISGNTGGTSSLTIQGWPYDHSGGAGSFQGGALNQCDGFDVESKGTNVTLNFGLGNAKLNILKQNTAITTYFQTISLKTGDFNSGIQVSIIGSFSYLTTDAATLNPGATLDP